MEQCFVLLIFCSLTLSSFAAAPANDLCAGAEVIPGGGPFPLFTATVLDATNATTTADPPPPLAACTQNDVSHSLWYRFTPSTNALYTISTGPDTATTVDDTVMAIYTSGGQCAGPFTRIDCIDDPGDRRAALSLLLNGGATYYIVVWISSAASVGPGESAVQLRVTRPVVPTNDICAGAEVIPGAGPFPHLTDVTDASLATAASDPPPPACQSSLARSVWYRFAPAVSASYVFSTDTDTLTTVYDTAMAIYTAPGCGGPFTLVACADDPNRGETMTNFLTAGTNYYLVVWETPEDDYFPGETSLQLRVSRQLPPQVATLPASSVTSTSAVLNATINPNGFAATAWFEWGATTNYGNQTPTQAIGDGSTNVALLASISSLSASNTYHFRAVATNAIGLARGVDQAFLRVNTRPSITHSQLVSGGPFRLRFPGAIGQVHLVSASTNLLQWDIIGPAVDVGGGAFEFADTNAPAFPSRFYRIVSP